MSSLLLDYFVRSTGSSHVFNDIIRSLPALHVENRVKLEEAVLLYLRLNCLTSAYAPLWEELTREKWTEDTPLRNAKERFHAQNSIDAIIALFLGVTADELCLIYRTQFPVMRRYDQEDLYDANGRKVAKEVVRAQATLKDSEYIPEDERTWAHPQSRMSYVYEYPFQVLDRETDLRMSYRKFSAALSM